MTRIVKDKDGRMRTVEDGPKIDLERARRETRDVIQGNVPFHTDPFAAPVAPKHEPPAPYLCACIPGYYTCEGCLNES